MILVTGASGLLGSFIVRELIGKGIRPKCLYRRNSDLQLLSDILSEIDLVEGDILDIPILEKSLIGISTVIHSAAIISFSSSLYEKMYKTNVEGTANLINVSIKAKVKTFLFVSSVASLGRRKNNETIDELSIWENSPHNSLYAQTKYLAELEVWRGSEEGIKTIIINPSIILGTGSVSKSSTRIFNHVLKESPFYPLGTINYVDVRDVAEIAIKLIESGAYNERFIISAGYMSYKNFFSILATKFNRRAPKIPVYQWMSTILWILSYLQSFFKTGEPLISKETTKTAQSNFYYNNSKIKKKLSYNFRNLDTTISWIADCLINK